MSANEVQAHPQKEGVPLIGARTILVCPNAFKGSLTASEAAKAIAAGIQRTVPVESHDAIVRLPLADGGDGTLETLVEATGGAIHRRRVSGPLGGPVEACWGRLGGNQQDVAVIEMASASGLRLLREDEYDPMLATTAGTGELMRAAIEAGCRSLLVGIGGSATNDGGMGMAAALGARFLDSDGNVLASGGGALARLAHIDLTDMHIPPDLVVHVACDVDNPLCGREGASAVYGPQKGATTAMVLELDRALAHYAGIIEEQLGIHVRDIPGAGAAGGLGAGLMAFCGAHLASGIEMVLDATDFDRHLRGCRLVVTGEGRMDGQTARGKVIAGVARRARQAGIPVIALAGSIAEGAETLLRLQGLTAALSILDGPMTVEQAMRDAARLLSDAAERLMRLLQVAP